MYKHYFTVLGVFILAGLQLLACSFLTPEEALPATLPAPAVSTRAATPTPTPLPRNLSLSVVDEAGAALSNITLVVADQSLTSDANGQIVVADLAESITVTGAVQGYEPLTQTLALLNGENAATAILIRDPDGILAADACLPNETLIFVEDFEDSMAQAFDNVERGMPGYSIEATDANDMVLTMLNPGYNALEYSGAPFSNSVLRFNMKFTGEDKDGVLLAWHENSDGSSYLSYSLLLNTLDGQDVYKQFSVGDAFDSFSMGVQGNKLAVETWHSFEIATRNDTTEITMDGTSLGSFTDTDPILAGGFSIAKLFIEDSETAYPAIQFDDFVLCSLTGEAPAETAAEDTTVPTAEPTAAPAQPAAASAAVTVHSITKTGDCGWDIHVSISGFAPNSQIKEETNGTLTDCAGNVSTLDSITDFGQFLTTDTNGTAEWVFSATQHGTYNVKFTDQQGNVGIGVYQVTP